MHFVGDPEQRANGLPRNFDAILYYFSFFRVSLSKLAMVLLTLVHICNFHRCEIQSFSSLDCYFSMLTSRSPSVSLSLSVSHDALSIRREKSSCSSIVCIHWKISKLNQKLIAETKFKLANLFKIKTLSRRSAKSLIIWDCHALKRRY